MGLRVTGDQSLPVRPYYAPNASRWRFEELEDRVYFLTQRSLRAERGYFLFNFEYVAAVA
jgi:hypothetical protein